MTPAESNKALVGYNYWEASWALGSALQCK